MRLFPALNSRILFFVTLILTIASPSSARVDLEHLARLQELEAKWGADVSLLPHLSCIGCVTSIEALQYNYGGVATFAHLRYLHCLVDKSQKFDVGIIGVPLDVGTSWRGGQSGVL